MAIVKKKLIDHVHIQYGYGGEHQKAAGVAAGEFSGAHFAEVEYLVDDATGDIVGQTNNPINGQAQPLDRDKIGAAVAALREQIPTQ